jgi:aspartokinase/homoserine dehydrogenase 1
MQVHKFGGTCVAAAERIAAICEYLVGGGDVAVGGVVAEQQVVVVSAMGSHPSSPLKVTELGQAGGRQLGSLLDL